MTDIRKLIATNLRSIMGQEDITPAMLADWAQLDPRTVNDLVWARRYVRMDSLELVAKALKRPVRDFFEE